MTKKRKEKIIIAKGKYHEWLTPDGLLLIKSFARDGLSDKEIARDKLHISTQTFYDWVKRFPDFSETIKKGRAPVNVVVEDTFFAEKLKGNYVSEETTETTINKDADGKIIGSSTHKRISKRFIPADTTAMIFYLKCRMGNKYNDKQVPNDAKIETEMPKLLEALKNPVENSLSDTAKNEPIGEETNDV